MPVFLRVAALTLALLGAGRASAAEAPPAPAEGTEKPRLLVLDFTASRGVSPEEAAALSQAAAAALSARGMYDVVTSRDVQTLLGLQRQKELLGCSEDSSSCMSELSGALGARYVFSGTLSRVADTFQLAVQTLDADRAQPVGRVTRIARDLAALRTSMPWTVAEATGLPPPLPPSRVLPYSLMAGGAAAGVAAGGLAMVAYAQEFALQRELDIGTRQTGVLGDYASYQDEFSRISLMKTGALVTLLVGAGLAAGGLALMPPDIGEGLGRVALWTSGSSSGFALGGTW